MTPELKKLCEEFIRNKDVVKEVFSFDFDNIYPVCSNIFLSHGKTADAGKIKDCKKYINQNTSIINNFRGPMKAPAACMLACSSDPENMMKQAAENYRMLKQYFITSDHLVLASMILTELTDAEKARKMAEKGKEIYKIMRKRHPLLTGDEDSVFALLLAFDDKNAEEIADKIETCFENLKGTAGKEYLHICAQILAMSNVQTEKKCERFKKLFNDLRESGIKYGKTYELSVLASLAVTDTDISKIVSDISEVGDFLSTQKGYKGLFGLDKQTRFMHAAMLVSTSCSPSDKGDIAATSAMVSIMIIQIILLLIVIDSATTAVSHSVNYH